MKLDMSFIGGENMYNKFIRTINLLIILFFSINLFSQNPGMEKNALNVLLDHSGSMQKNNRIVYTNNSTKTLLEIIRLWSELYPDRIGTIDFQIINFGGENEIEIIHPLSSITNDNLNEILKKVDNSRAIYKNTDYNNAFQNALENMKMNYKNVRTIFLTDGIDEGEGPQNNINYDSLGDTKFIVFDVKNLRVDRWTKRIKYADAYYLSNEFEVTSIFVTTLFEYVDDINKYLVRRGSQHIKNNTFNFNKHSSKESQQIIVNKMKKDIKIKHIVDSNNVILSNSLYDLYDKSTFFQINFSEKLLKGDYKIVFENNCDQCELFYISFEKVNIVLNLLTNPPLDGPIYENSAINAELIFKDTEQNIPINYNDFIQYAAYYCKIGDFKKYTNRGIENLKFVIQTPENASGSYDIKTAWSYNQAKLIEGFPQLTTISEVNISKPDILLDLQYDKNDLWEGRDLEIIASIVNPELLDLTRINDLKISTGNDQEIITLQKKNDENFYSGKIEKLQPKIYQLSLNECKDFKLALSAKSETCFSVNKRNLVLQTELINYDFYEKISLWEKIKQAWFDLTNKKNYNKTKQINTLDKDLVLCYGLPYKGEVQFNTVLDIYLNKIFPDEEIEINIKTEGDTIFSTKLAKSQAYKLSFLGLIKREFKADDIVRIDFDYKNSNILTSKNNNARIILNLRKLAAIVNFDETLSIAPKIVVSVVNSKNMNCIIETREIAFDIKTSSESLWFYQIANIGFYVFLIILFLLIILCGLILGLLFIRKRVKKSEIWNNSKNKSPEDFYHMFPEKLKNEIEATYLKNLFNDKPDLSRLDAEIRNKRMYKFLKKNNSKYLDKIIKKNCTYSNIRDLEVLLIAKVTERVFIFTNENNKSIRITNNEPDPYYDEINIRLRDSLFTYFGEFRVNYDQLFFNPATIQTKILKIDGEMHNICTSNEVEINDVIIINDAYKFTIDQIKDNIKISYTKINN